jgi:hypothetical protein
MAIANIARDYSGQLGAFYFFLTTTSLKEVTLPQLFGQLSALLSEGAIGEPGLATSSQISGTCPGTYFTITTSFQLFP